MSDWRNRIHGTGSEDPVQLLANPGNWRIHPAGQGEALQAILDAVGWVGTVMVNRTTGHVVDGHLRVQRAIAAGQTQVPVTYVDLTEDEERAVLATFDYVTGMAATDTSALLALLDEIDAPPELQWLLDQVRSENPERRAHRADPDRVPDVPAQAITAPGDLWLMGDHELLCGDSTDPACIEKAMGGARADAMVTDPPYGVAYKAEGHAYIANDALSNYREWFASWLTPAAAVMASYNTCYVFMSDQEYAALKLAMVDAGWTPSQLLIWVKNAPVLGRKDYNAAHELIAYGWHGKHKFHGGYPSSLVRDDRPAFDRMSKKELVSWASSVWGTADVIAASRPRKATLHPTMKPVALVQRLIEDGTPVGATVLDPFGGSGTTLIACDLAARQARLVELSPAYCDVIVTRWLEVCGGTATLAATGQSWEQVCAERSA